MKRKNLNVTKLKNAILKDKKISKIYSKLNFTTKNTKSFLAAISGGSDSMALALLSKLLKEEKNKRIYFVHVDHAIRKNSSKEALQLKNILKKYQIDLKIIKNKKNIQKNIQKNAREMRYSLISNYCLKKKINYLMTAHHEDDQIETFLIRLFRGSGLTGLSSMSEKSKYSNKLKIIRPFLSFKKRDLQHVTLKYFKTFVKDPSNENNKFLRIRVRKYKKDMEKEGLDTRKIINTVNNLESANKALNFYKNKALQKHSSFISKNKCLINNKIFLEEANEIIFKSFSDVLSLVSGTYYPPRSKKITSLINRVKKNEFKKSTLGGCVIEKRDNFIIISRELKTKKMSYQPQK